MGNSGVDAMELGSGCHGPPHSIDDEVLESRHMAMLDISGCKPHCGQASTCRILGTRNYWSSDTSSSASTANGVRSLADDVRSIMDDLRSIAVADDVRSMADDVKSMADGALSS